jgi:hypothetical protein
VARVRETGLAPEFHGERYCFAVLVRGVAMVGCSPDEMLCLRARSMAAQYGSLVGITEIGSCSSPAGQ